MSARPLLVAILGPTVTGKSALAVHIAQRYDGEIVSCDSTAVYRGFDIGTDKVPVHERRGVPHHMIDVADPTEIYSAAQYARAAAQAIRDISGRGRLPIVAGGTGLYYRALTRGLFAGPGRDPALRARLEAIAAARGPERLHRMLLRIDEASARRIQARDLKRIVRALEVYFGSGRTMTEHFADTRSPLAEYEVAAVALQIPSAELSDRVARRVDAQFARGVVGEVRGLLAGGVPADAQMFGGLVYRQVVEHLRGDRDEAATRELIARANRKYARRQLIWFRKEPNLTWVPGPGESHATQALVEAALAARLVERLRARASDP